MAVFGFPLLLTTVHASGGGLVPVGPEIHVDTHTTSLAFAPSIAADAEGRFVVVWESWGQDGGAGIAPSGVFGQRFHASGAALGSEFQVNSYTTGFQGECEVASDPAGTFVVVWTSIGQDGGERAVFARRYDATGTEGAEFRVNTETLGRHFRPDVAMDGAGRFVVVWQGRPGTANYSIYGQRYDGAGAAQGSQFRVNTDTTDIHMDASVAMDAVGNFVVVWKSFDRFVNRIRAQRFNASGTADGGEIEVSEPMMLVTMGDQDSARPSVAMDAAGDFAVVWTDSYPPGDYDGHYSGVFGQRYDAAGATVGGHFQVNSYTFWPQREPAVASDGDGNFMVVWQSDFQDENGYGVFGQAYDASGAPAGGEFQVHTFTTGDQFAPAVVANGSGRFVTAWVNYNQDSPGNSGVAAQRFATDLIFRDGLEAASNPFSP